MKKYTCLFVSAFAVAAALWLSGCGEDECIVCPPEPQQEKEYHFLYSFVGTFQTARVYTYSTLTGEVVDTAYYGTLPFNDMRFSRDGRYAYYTVDEPAPGATWVTDYQTGDTLAIAPGIWGHWLQLFPDERYLILSGGGIYLRVLSLPSLEVVYEELDSSGFGNAGVHPTKPVAYISKRSEDSLLILEVQNNGIQRSKRPLTTGDGQPARSFNAAVTRDGGELIITADYFPVGAAGGFLQLRDSETFELKHEYSPGRAIAYLHPAGKRVYFLECSKWSSSNPGGLWELDLETYMMTRVLRGEDFAGGFTDEGFDPLDMDFTPDGRHAVLNGGGCGLASGPILFVDLDDFSIQRAIWLTVDRPRTIRMYPIAVNK